MTMYVIKDDDGFVLDRVYLEFTSDIDCAMLFDEPIAPAEYAKRYGGHVVELVEKPEPVVVSEDMASWLSDAKEMRMPIEFLARCKVPDGDQEDMLRAYVNGWTVEKPKRWNVKVPHADGYWFYLRENNKPAPVSDHAYAMEFTLAQIHHYGLDDCEKVECDNDD